MHVPCDLLVLWIKFTLKILWKPQKIDHIRIVSGMLNEFGRFQQLGTNGVQNAEMGINAEMKY